MWVEKLETSSYTSFIVSKKINLMPSVQIDQIAASISAFFWPKILFDFRTQNFDVLVKPFPFLQILNMGFGFFMFAWDYPVYLLAGSSLHRSIVARLVFLPVVILASVFMYQGTNPAIYYTIGLVVYFIAFSEGEVWSRSLVFIYSWHLASTVEMLTERQVVAQEPWTLPFKSG